MKTKTTLTRAAGFIVAIMLTAFWSTVIAQPEVDLFAKRLMSPVDVQTPGDAKILDTDITEATVSVRNKGGSYDDLPADSFGIVFAIDGTPIDTLIGSADLDAGSGEAFDFTNLPLTEPGLYEITWYPVPTSTGSYSDTVPGNDTGMVDLRVLKWIAPMNNSYSEDLDACPDEYFTEAALWQTTWECGVPSFGTPDGTGSSWFRPDPGQQAKVSMLQTDELSYVQFPVFDFSGFIYDPVINMDIYYNTVSGFGITLQYSTNGVDYYPVGGYNTQDIYAQNWFNTEIMNFIGGPGWSGNSNGWVNVSHSLKNLAGENEVYLRVAFVGEDDSQIQKGVNEAAFDNVSIEESFGVMISSTANDVTNDNMFYSIMRGECVTLTADIYGSTSLLDTVYWYSMTAEQVIVDSWWCQIWPQSVQCDTTAPPSVSLINWTCDSLGVGPSLTVCPDSSTYYYAVVNNGDFKPCDQGGVAWPFMPPGAYGNGNPQLKVGPTFVYGAAAVAVIDTLTVAAEFDGHNVCDTAITPVYAFPEGGLPPYTYAWSPTATLSGSSTDSIAYSVANNTTTYTVTVTDALGNTATDDVTISVVSGYAFVDIVPNNALLCDGDSVLLTVYGGSGWSWYTIPAGAATFSDTNGVNTWVIPTGTHSSFDVWVDVTSSCGPASTTMQLDILPPPAAPTFNNPGGTTFEVCSDDPIVDLAASVVPSPAGGTFSGPGVINGLFDPSAVSLTPPSSSSYTITYTIEGPNGCKASNTFTMLVFPNPELYMDITGVDTVCVDEVQSYTASPVPSAIDTIEFFVTGGTIIGVSGSDNETVSVQWDTPGIGIVDAVYYGTYCTAYLTDTVIVNPLPVFDITSAGSAAAVDTFVYCEGEIDSLFADITPGGGTGFGGYSVDWDVYDYSGGGLLTSYSDVVGMPESAAVNTLPNNEDIQYYQIAASVYDSSTGCYAYDTAYVKVFNTPEIDFFAPGYDTLKYCIDACEPAQDLAAAYGSDYTFTIYDSNGDTLLDNGQTFPAICFDSLYSGGDTVIYYAEIYLNGCMGMDSAVLVLWELPEVYDLTSDDPLNFCYNTVGPELYMADSDIEDQYDLYRDGSPVASVYGDGDSVSFGNFNIPGEYWVIATDTITGCTNAMGDTLTLVSDTIGIDLLSEFDTVCPTFTSRMTVDFDSLASVYGPYLFDWDPTGVKFTPDGYGTGIARPGSDSTLYTVTVYASADSLCTATDSFLLEVLDAPSPVRIGDTANSIVNVTDTSICAGSSIDLQVAWVPGSGNVTSITWSPMTGVTPDAHLTQPVGVTLAPTVATTYKVEVQDEFGCIGRDSVNVVVNNAPLVQINNNIEPTICPDIDTTLIANVTLGSGGPYTYYWAPDITDPDVVYQNADTLVVSPSVTTTYNVTVYDHGYDCYGYASLTVNVSPAPTITDMGEPYFTCQWGEINLNPTYTGSPAVFTWTQIGGTGVLPAITSTSNPTVAMNGIAADVYEVELTIEDVNGCTVTDSAFINVTVGPSISAGPDEYICEGTTVTLTGQGGNGTTSYSWYSDTNYAPENLLANWVTVDVTPDTTTTYFLRVNNDSCGVATSQVTVYVHPETDVFFDGLLTDHCEVDMPYTLTNITPVGGTFSGEGVDPVTGMFDPGAVSTKDAPITILYEYADSSAYPLYPVCTYSHSMTTTVWSTPTVTIDPVAAVCEDATPFPVANFNGMPATPAGTYTVDGTVVAGNVDPAALGAGIYDVWYYYTDIHGCMDSAMTTFEVLALPQKYDLIATSPTNGGHYCDGDSSEITLSNSEVDVTYDLIFRANSSATGTIEASIPGTGSSLSFGMFASDGFYHVVGTNDTSTCTAVVSDTVELIEEELPQQFNLIVENGGHYCADGACETTVCSGVKIGMFSTNSEDKYYLYEVGGSGTPLAEMNGTDPSGQPKWFPGIFTAGTYYVEAIDTTTPAMCPRLMLDTVTVTEDPKPAVVSLSKDNVCQCPGEYTTISISSATDTTVDYVLYYGGVSVDTINGTTSFDPVNVVGTYTVVAYKRSSGANMWNNPIFGVPATWSTVCVDTMGTIDVCEYINASIDDLRFYDMEPATPTTMTIDGGDEGYIKVDFTVDTQPYTIHWEVSTDGGMDWDTVYNAMGMYSGATTDSLVLDSVMYPMMKGWKYRFIIDAHCGNDTSDVVTIDLRPNITVYAGEPVWAKSLDTVFCADQILLPIYVENFDSVGAVSLVLGYDETEMTWSGTAQNIHPLFQAVNPQIGPGLGAGKIAIAAQTLSPINIGNDVLLYLPFTMSRHGGYSDLTWDLTVPGRNQLADVTANLFKAKFVNGSVTGLALPYADASVTPVEICEGDDITLSANPYSTSGGGPINHQGTWITPSKVFNVNDTTFTVDLTDSGPYQYLISDLNNCSFDTTINVQVNPLPTVFDVYPAADSACVGGAVEIGLSGSQVGVKYYLMFGGIVYDPPGYAPYVIEGTGNPITFGPVAAPTNMGLGTFGFSVKAVDTTFATHCDIMMNGVAQITITPRPFSFDLRLIDEGAAVISGDYCAGGSGLPVVLGGSQLGVTYELWYAPYCCTCPDSLITTLQGTGSSLTFPNQTLPGYYHVRAYYNGTLCDEYMNNCVFIEINDLPTAEISGDAVICEGETTDLTIDLTGKAPFTVDVYPLGTYSTNSYQLVIPVSPAGHTIYSVTNVEDDNGCTNTGIGTATVTVNPLPAADAQSDKTEYCAQSDAVIWALPQTGMTYQWSGPNGYTSTVQRDTLENVDPITDAGWYYLTVTNATTGCTAYDSVELIINRLPNAGPRGDEVCEGETIELNGSLDSYGLSGSIVTYQWAGPNGFASSAADTSFGPATLAMGGVYSLTVVDDNGCMDVGQASVTVHALPNADAGIDQDICYGDCATLVATGGDSYEWSNGIYNDTNIVCPTDTTTYSVIVTESHGQVSCVNYDTVTVNVLPLPIPYELTQNGIYCFGCFGIPVNMVNSEIGVNYVLYHQPLAGGAFVPVDTLAGIGDTLYFGDIEVPGFYKVLGYNVVTGCENWMSNTIKIGLRPAPTATFAEDTFAVCENECDTLTLTLTGLTPFTVHYTDGSVVTYNDADLTYEGMPSGVETWTKEIEVCGSSAPAYIGIDLVEDSVCFRTGDTVIIQVDPLPGEFDVTGGGYYCNIGLPVGLAGSEVGVSYILVLGNGPSAVALDTLPGTGAAISFGAQTQIGTYTVFAYNDATGCGIIMNGEAEITSGILPEKYNIYGDNYFCTGDSASIHLDGSQIGVTYELLLNGISTGVTVPGTGSILSFGKVATVGTYEIQGIDDSTSCIALMNGDLNIVEKALPTANVSGSTTICSGDNAMITVTFTGTPPFSFDVNGTSYSTSNYTWTKNYSPMSTTVYKVNFVYDEYCSNVGGDSATVTVSKPTAFTITGGGVYCEGGLGRIIGLNGSQTGVTYELYLDGIATGQTVAGTGSAISFGYQTADGVYSIVGTFDGNGCSGNMTGTVTIDINPLPELMTVTGGDSCCVGCQIIYVGLDSTEYDPNMRYELWRNGSLYTNPAFPPKYGTGAAIEWGYMTQAGTYTIRAVNELTGCERFMDGSAVAYFFPEPAGYISGDDTICEGETSQFTVTFTAGTPPFSVLIFEDGDTLQYFNNIPGPTFTYTTPVLSPGPHTYELVEIADDTCFAQATGTATIFVNELPQVSLSMPAGYCFDAVADSLDYGYPAGGTYTINGTPAVEFDPSVVGVGTHTIEYTYTDPNGCTASASTTVEVYALPICDVTGGTYCIDDAAFTLTTGTPVGGSYYIDGMSASSFDPASYGVGGYELLYSYTDSNGCVCSSTDSIFVIDKPNVSMDAVPDVCLNGAPVTLTGTPSGGIFSGMGVTGNTFDPTAVSGPGSYMITYEITAGVCAAVDTQYVYVNDLPMDMPLVGDTLVCEFTNQDVGMGGTESGIEYQLYRNGNIINGQLITGTGSAMTFGTQSQEGIYTVYAEDPVTGCGRFMSDSAIIEWIPLPTVTTFGNGTHCTGDSTAVEFVFTGTPPFTLEYTINGADYVVSGILDSNYLLTFPNLVNNMTITNVRVIDLTCYNDGADVIITVLPPTADVNMTGGGSYCAGDPGVAVGIDSTVAGVFYELYKDGVATTNVVVGTGAAISFGPQTAGTYTAVATGSGSCQTDVLGSAVVVENALPTVVATAMPDTICIGESATLTASGADTYEWSTGDLTSSATVSPTSTTTYTVTGTSVDGCTDVASVTVVVNPAPVVDITATSTSLCVGTSTDLTASGADTYVWSTGDMTATINVTPTGTTTYYVTGTDINGCTAVDSITIDVFTNPTVDVTPAAPAICLGESVLVTASGADTYEWNTTETTAGITVSPTSTTTYTVTGTVAGGCTAEASVTVTVNTPPVLSITSDLTICEGGSATLTVSGADTYEWSTTETTASIVVSPMSTTTYTVTGTSVDGCTATADVTVTVATPQAVDAGSDQTITTGGSATIAATVTGGSGSFDYLWTPGGQTTASIVVNPTDTTTYVVEVTDLVSGCVVTDDVTVNVISVVGDIAGMVTYKNAAGTPMNNTPVALMQGSTTVATTTTDATGAYTFTNVYAGSYTVMAEPTKAWGGVNSNDALLILKHSTGLALLNGLNLKAADVTGEGFVNATDALEVAKRFVNLVTTFGAGDWTSDETPVSITSAGLVSGVDVEVLCTGDVNGSFTPAAKATVQIINSGVKEISSFETIEVPVSVSKDMTVGAISLVLDYPEDAVGVEGVLLGTEEPGSLLYTDYNGVLRISWYNMSSFQVEAGEALVTLELRVKDLNYVLSDVIEITTNTESQIGDARANVIENVNLTVPKLTVKVDEYSINNYPNPFDETTQFEYTLPEDGKVTLRVYNMLGEQVNVLVNNKAQEAGTYKVEFRAANLTPGTYTYQFEVNGETRQFTKTGMMVLTK